MVERYHLALAAQALGVGAILAALDRWGPRGLTVHLVGLAALTGAVLGGWGSPRVLPWLVAGAVVSALPDRSIPPHPVGRWVMALAVLSLIGVWSAVPDTEPPLAAACVLMPLAGVRVLRGPVIGPAGTAALVASVWGAVWVGSAGWGEALAVGCAVGMVLIGPIVVGFGDGRFTPCGWWSVVAAHGVVALVVPRSIMGRSVPVAVVMATGALMLLGLVALVVRRAPAPVPGSVS